MSECRFCQTSPVVEVDPETGDVYVRILAGWGVLRTETRAVGVNVDLGVGDHVVGVEVLR